MKHTYRLPIPMTALETWLGLLYLPVQLLVLPSLLMIGNGLLGQPLSASAVNFVFFALNFACILAIFHKYLWNSLGLTLQNLGRCLFMALRGYILYYLGNFATGLIIMYLAPDFSNVNDASIMALTQENFRMMAVGTVLLVPLVEETLYRGVIFGSLHRKSPILAYAVSSIVFSFVHVAGYIGAYEIKLLALCFLQYIPAGLSLAWAYERSGSIFAPVLIHTTVNAMGIFAMR